ncbi:50S ribosomal protein L25 [Chloroflexota bacterium]
MDQIVLKATNRETLGKKVRFLRRQGVTPAHLFGHGIESVALQCNTADIHKVLAEAGQTRIVSLKLENEKKPRNVIIREVQIEPCKEEVLHVDFYQVQMAEQVRVEIPIVLVGEAPALKLKENMLVHDVVALTVECLPAKIPDRVEVDITSLTDSDQAVRVKDIKLGEGVTVLTDPELMIVRISLRHMEKLEEVVEEEEKVEATAEAAEAPGEEAKEE